VSYVTPCSLIDRHKRWAGGGGGYFFFFRGEDVGWGGETAFGVVGGVRGLMGGDGW